MHNGQNSDLPFKLANIENAREMRSTYVHHYKVLWHTVCLQLIPADSLIVLKKAPFIRPSSLLFVASGSGALLGIFVNKFSVSNQHLKEQARLASASI